MELFTFLLASGSEDVNKDVLIYPMTPANDPVGKLRAMTSLIDKFQNFDGKEASCWRESERELLQSIIERGFGKMDKFNTNVRTMMRSCVRNSRAKTCVDLRQGTSRKLLKGQAISTGEQAPLTVEGAAELKQEEKDNLAKFFDETPRPDEAGTSSRRGSLFRLSSSAQIHPSA